MARAPKLEELAQLAELDASATLARLQYQIGAVHIKRACGVPMSAQIDPATGKWIDERGRPIEFGDAALADTE